MVFGRKSKIARMQQQQQMAALQMQVRQLQQQTQFPHQNMGPMVPTEIHHHTHEIVNNVPTYIPVPMAAEPVATFVEPPMPTYMREFAEPPLPIAENWGPIAAGPVAPMSPMMSPLMSPAVGGGVEYRSHLQHLDGTWEHSSWWE